MSRIRSVHPAIFTDEAFASISIPARILLIGIWTECFDDGVFEWKPLTLKMRIFPADNLDVAELLAELVTSNTIKSFEKNGKSYGAVRNFCRFQRPKKPNSSGVMCDEVASYVSFDHPKDGVSSEPVPNQFRTSSEKSSQMEDGGWRMEDGDISNTTTDVVVSSASRAADHAEHVEIKIARQKRDAIPPNAILEIGAAWNDMAASFGIPQIDTIDGDRKRSVEARAKEFSANYEFSDPVDGFKDLFARVRGSPFLRGQVPSRDGRPAFRATFDWCVSPRNFRKIMEGNYENQIQQPSLVYARSYG